MTRDTVNGWLPEVEELERRKELARRMGGPANIARQHAQGKLTVRERIDRLLDSGSFRELGILAAASEYGDARHHASRCAGGTV